MNRHIFSSMFLAEYYIKSKMKGAHLKSGWIGLGIPGGWILSHSITEFNFDASRGPKLILWFAISDDLVMFRLIPFCPLKYTLFATWPYAIARN